MLKELFNCPVFIKNKETYLRCYSIKDSDRKFCFNANDLPENTNTFLKDNNIPHHILYKRAKENYMPNVILEKSNNDYFKTILKVFKDDLKRDFFILILYVAKIIFFENSYFRSLIIIY